MMPRSDFCLSVLIKLSIELDILGLINFFLQVAEGNLCSLWALTDPVPCQSCAQHKDAGCNLHNELGCWLDI